MSNIKLNKRQRLAFHKYLRAVAEAGGYFPEMSIGVLPQDQLFRDYVAIGAPAFELLVFNDEADSVFLAPYDGGIEEIADWLHIPGGYVKSRWDSVQAACNAIAGKEIGIPVEYLGDVSTFLWQKRTEPMTQTQHWYGRPCATYVVCRPVHPVIERERAKFYRLDSLPAEPMSPPHRLFLEQWRFWLPIAKHWLSLPAEARQTLW